MSDLSETQEPFVLAADVRAGDFLVTDGGFTCLGEGEHKQVFQDEQYVGTDDEFTGLYIYCAAGRHYLGGQLGGPFGGFDTDDHLVGLWKLR